MIPFRTLTSTAVPLRAENVDTDQIIPARYLTTVSREGLGQGLFAAWRNPDFVLDQPERAQARILLAGQNFGSGSSREHAVWALADYGFRAVIAPTFADIFYNNSLKNGLLPLALAAPVVERLFAAVEGDPRAEIAIDLESQIVALPDGSAAAFEIEPFRKRCLLEGLDDLGYLLSRLEPIEAYERGPGCSTRVG
ncbi:MAG: 3-isopropylmalate dehydratase small subunit [Armatimonadetes bacterium]|nr:3-isopropylmalate dehydratase small subunit [Armatimonadota bacterium]